MIRRIKEIYRQQSFFPGWLGIFVNPFYFARAGLCEAMTRLSPILSGRLLDVGCGAKPYQRLFTVDAYVGLDIDSAASRKLGTADYFYDGNAFPFDDDSFDAVLCNQVLEHVFSPDTFLGEVKRVLKPEGKFLLTVPFVWDEHEQPFDYGRYSSFGLRALLEKQDFKVIQHDKSGADVTVIFQLFNAYLFKVTQSLPAAFKVLLTVTVMAFINILGLLFRYILPANPDLFLDNIVLAERDS